MIRQSSTKLKIGKNAFILAFSILLILMIICGILTKVIDPADTTGPFFKDRSGMAPKSVFYHCLFLSISFCPALC